MPIETAITIANVAKLLGVSQRLVHRMIKEGNIPPPFRLGHGIRFRASQIDGWIRLGCPTDGSSKRRK